MARIFRQIYIGAVSVVWSVAPVFAAFVGPAMAGDVHIGVAANFKTAADALGGEFEKRSGHDIITTSGSTGKIYAQIVNGAPFDVFLAADQERPDRLEAEGVALSGSRFTYAIGQLVLWDPAGGAVGPHRLEADTYARLAIANPDLAPYGAAAQQVIDALGLDGAVNGKRVFGENIGQTFAFVRTQNAELGFVALSQILSLPQGARGAHWTPPQTLYAPIRQDGVLLARAKDNEAAKAFVEFLKSDDAVAIIEGFGYAQE